MLRMFENKSDARTRAHFQSCRETVDMSADTFRTACQPVCGKCFWSAMRPRIAFIRTEVLLKCRDLSNLSVAIGRPDLLVSQPALIIATR
jgi:hypothetical protein